MMFFYRSNHANGFVFLFVQNEYTWVYIHPSQADIVQKVNNGGLSCNLMVKSTLYVHSEHMSDKPYTFSKLKGENI